MYDIRLIILWLKKKIATSLPLSSSAFNFCYNFPCVLFIIVVLFSSQTTFSQEADSSIEITPDTSAAKYADAENTVQFEPAKSTPTYSSEHQAWEFLNNSSGAMSFKISEERKEIMHTYNQIKSDLERNTIRSRCLLNEMNYSYAGNERKSESKASSFKLKIPNFTKKIKQIP